MMIPEILDAAKSFVGGMIPAALGAFVAQVHERGLAWRDRLLAYLSGITVSYYVTLGLQAWLKFDPFVAQAVGFVVAMIAFKSTPRFISGASDAIASAPGKILEWISPREAKK